MAFNRPHNFFENQQSSRASASGESTSRVPLEPLDPEMAEYALHFNEWISQPSAFNILSALLENESTGSIHECIGQSTNVGSFVDAYSVPRPSTTPVDINPYRLPSPDARGAPQYTHHYPRIPSPSISNTGGHPGHTNFPTWIVPPYSTQSASGEQVAGYPCLDFRAPLNNRHRGEDVFNTHAYSPSLHPPAARVSHTPSFAPSTSAMWTSDAHVHSYAQGHYGHPSPNECSTRQAQETPYAPLATAEHDDNERAPVELFGNPSALPLPPSTPQGVSDTTAAEPSSGPVRQKRRLLPKCPYHFISVQFNERSEKDHEDTEQPVTAGRKYVRSVRSSGKASSAISRAPADEGHSSLAEDLGHHRAPRRRTGRNKTSGGSNSETLADAKTKHKPKGEEKRAAPRTSERKLKHQGQLRHKTNDCHGIIVQFVPARNGGQTLRKPSECDILADVVAFLGGVLPQDRDLEYHGQGPTSQNEEWNAHCRRERTRYTRECLEVINRRITQLTGGDDSRDLKLTQLETKQRVANYLVENFGSPDTDEDEDNMSRSDNEAGPSNTQ